MNTWAQNATRRRRFPTLETGTSDKRTPLRLAVGDVVVYGFYGVALIAARQSLRSLADESDVARVEETLGANESASEAQWTKRFRATREKVVGGQVTGLAEVVRDGSHREHRQALRSGPMPSPAERELYVRARRLLAEEVGAVRGIDLPAADNWVTEQIDAAIEAQANEPPGIASKRRRRKTDG